MSNKDQKYSINELENEVNNKIEDVGSKVSVRRIRDYMTKGLLEKPFGVGKDKWFGEMHVNSLVALRKLKEDGLSDKSLSKIIRNESVVYGNDLNESDNKNKNEALNLLGEISNKANLSNNIIGIAGSSNVSGSITRNKANLIEMVGSVYERDVNMINRAIGKKYIEYSLDKSNKIYLKVEEGMIIEDKEEILKTVKSILNIK